MIVEPILNDASRNFMFFLRLFGLYPGPASSRLYIYYGYFIILVFSIIYTSSMVFELFRLRDWSDSTEAIYMTLTEVALVVKILNFRMLIKNMAEMVGLTQNFELESDDEIELLRHYVKRLVQISIFYYVAVSYAQSSVEIAAAFDESIALPYSAWYPYFDWKHNNYHYWVLFTYQVFGMFVTAFTNVSLELFGALLMCMNTFQMEVLGIRARKLGYYSVEINIRFRFSRDELRDVRSKLVRYIKHHQAITRYLPFHLSID